MAVSKAKKIEVLASIEKELKNATSVAFTSNTKLTVEEVTRLRKELIKVDASFTLVKKTLIRIAFKNVYGVELTEDIMPGQVAVVISKWDKIAGISIVNKYATELRKEEKIKFVGAYFDGQVLDAAAATKIATLPSREVLLSKLLGSMKAPISALARFLDAAKWDLESKKLTKVSDLIGSLSVKEEIKVEEPKVEEKAPEAIAEVPLEETKEEVTPEVPVEEVKEEVVETPAEVAVEETKEETTETVSEETPA